MAKESKLEIDIPPVERNDSEAPNDDQVIPVFGGVEQAEAKAKATDQTVDFEPHYDEKINQIDQIEDYLIYQGFDQVYKSIQFESQVKNIVENFQLFIRQSYNKLFGETVLMNLSIANDENDQSYLTEADFA